MKILKPIKRIMLVIISGVILLFLFSFFYQKHPKFGKLPSGERLEIIKKSPNYKNGQFQNLNPTPGLVKGTSKVKLFWDFFFKKIEDKEPLEAIPSIKTDIKSLDINQDVLIWFGHSSYYFQLAGKRFLVDPVFSGSVSPVPKSGKSFKGTDIYSVEDFPEIDYLLITHDHYDHLDYSTIIGLKDKVKTVICGLGVGAHLEFWKYAPSQIIEKNWYDSVKLTPELTLTLTPARHFSGRTFQRNTSLWTSFVVEAPDYKMYLGGDSGYDVHFKQIGEQFGPFDLAILENGQYNEKWKYIHTFPEQIHMVAKDLKTKRFFPVHSSKFALAQHSWKEPLEKVAKYNQSSSLKMITPKIGELVSLKDEQQVFDKWWENI